MEQPSFWPETAAGWLGLVTASLAVLTGFAAVLGKLLPWLRRQFRIVRPQDIRVNVAAVIGLRGAEADPESQCIRIRVENHSDRDFFLSAVTLHEGGKDGHGMWTERDYATQKTNNGQTVAAGDAYDYYIPLRVILESELRDHLRYGVAIDRLGRKYLSPRKQLREAMKESGVYLQATDKRKAIIPKRHHRREI